MTHAHPPAPRWRKIFPLLGFVALLGGVVDVAGAPREGPIEVGTPDSSPRADDLARWIAGLGAERWEDREEATNALLEAGPTAIPILRSFRESPDPEIRNRVQWLLTILAPPIYTVDLVRLGGDARPLEPQEWIRLGFPQRSRGEGESRRPDGTGRRMLATIEGEVEPLQLSVEIGAERNTITMEAPIALETVTLLEDEERFEVDDVAGRVTIVRHPALWVVRVRRTKGPPEDDAPADADAVRARLEEWLGQVPIEQAIGPRGSLRVASGWGRLDLLPSLDTVPANAQLEVAVARLRAGDLSAAAILEAALRGETPDRTVLDPSLAHDVALALLERTDAKIALDRIVVRYSGSTLWQQHQLSGALLDRLQDPEFATEHGVALLSMLIGPGNLSGIYWQDGQTVALLQELQDRLSPDQFAGVLRPVLGEVLGDDGGTAGIRLRVLLRVVLRSLRESETSTTEWLEPMIRLLGGSFIEDAFALLIDRRQIGAIDDDAWLRVRSALAENFSQPDAGLLIRTRTAVEQLLADPDLSSADRRQLWLDQLACFPLPGQSLRMQVDRTLLQRFQLPSAEKTPNSKSDAVWAARGKAWREHLSALPDEKFALSPPPEGGPWLLTLVDLRVDEDRDEITLIDARSGRVVPGQSRPEIAADLTDQSLSVIPYEGMGRPGMFRLPNRSSIYTGRPMFRGRMRVRWRHSEHVAAAGRLGLLAASRPRTVQFETLVYLEEGSEAAPLADPNPDATAEEVWQQVRERLVAGLEGADTRNQQAFLDAIARFRIEEARESLIASYTKAPSVEGARALLALGDLRGKDLLLSTIESGRGRVVEILGDLLRAGEPAALETAFELLESTPVRGVSSYRLIQVLDRSLDHPQLLPQLDVDRFYAALIGALEQRGLPGVVIPILRRRTGLDLGYYDAFQIRDQKEREAAQAENLQRWRDWWAAREESSER